MKFGKKILCGVLLAALLLAGCGKEAPGNEMPPQDGPQLSTEAPAPERTRGYTPRNMGTFSYMTAVRNDGTVVTGEVYDGENPYLEEVSQWTNVAAVSQNYEVIVALRTDGTVLAAGDLDETQRREIAGWTNVTEVAAGYYEILALRDDGTVLSSDPHSAVHDWKDIVGIDVDFTGVLGLRSDGTVVYSQEGMDFSSWTDIVDIAMGMGTALGLRSDGTVVGVNVDEAELSTWSDIVDVDIYMTGMGLRADGTVMVLEDESLASMEVDTAVISGWTDVAAIETWGASFFGLRSDGTILSAGLDEGGQLDVGHWRNIAAVQCANYATIALCDDGTVLMTGREEEVLWTDIMLQIPEIKPADVPAVEKTDETVVCSYNGFTITAGKFGPNTSGGFDLELYAENRTNEAVLALTEYWKLGEYFVTPYLHLELEPGESGTFTATLDRERMELAGVTQFDGVEVSFKLVNGDTFATIYESAPVALDEAGEVQGIGSYPYYFNLMDTDELKVAVVGAAADTQIFDMAVHILCANRTGQELMLVLNGGAYVDNTQIMAYDYLTVPDGGITVLELYLEGLPDVPAGGVQELKFDLALMDGNYDDLAQGAVTIDLNSSREITNCEGQILPLGTIGDSALYENYVDSEGRVYYWSEEVGGYYMITPVAMDDGTSMYSLELSDYSASDLKMMGTYTVDLFGDGGSLVFFDFGVEIEDCAGIIAPVTINSDNCDLTGYRWVVAVNSDNNYIAMANYDYEDGVTRDAAALFPEEMTISAFSVLPNEAMASTEGFTISTTMNIRLLFTDPLAVMDFLESIHA